MKELPVVSATVVDCDGTISRPTLLTASHIIKLYIQAGRVVLTRPQFGDLVDQPSGRTCANVTRLSH